MAKKQETFGIGDYVVYPTHGVGKISAIETQTIAGEELRLFVIVFELDRMTLCVPVEKAETSRLRRLSTRQQMEKTFVVLKGRSRSKRTMWSRRAQEYEAKLNSGDPMAIAEVVRDLYPREGQPDQSFSERKMYEAALSRLARELAAVDKTDEPTAAERLETIMEAA